MVGALCHQEPEGASLDEKVCALTTRSAQEPPKNTIVDFSTGAARGILTHCANRIEEVSESFTSLVRAEACSLSDTLSDYL